jgi:hypothetical protein
MVTRWRLYSPEFRAALANQRAVIWGAAADRLRGKRAAGEAESEAATTDTKSQARAAARKGTGGSRRAPRAK